MPYLSYMERNRRAKTKAHTERRGLKYKPMPKRKSPNRRRTKKVKKRKAPKRRRTAKQRKSSNKMVDAPSRRSKRPSVRRFAEVVEQNLEFDRQQAAERQRKKSLKQQNKKDIDELADMFSRF